MATRKLSANVDELLYKKLSEEAENTDRDVTKMLNRILKDRYEKQQNQVEYR